MSELQVGDVVVFTQQAKKEKRNAHIKRMRIIAPTNRRDYLRVQITEVHDRTKYEVGGQIHVPIAHIKHDTPPVREITIDNDFDEW